MSVLIKGMEMPKSCDVCCFDLFVESCPLYNATPEDLVGITWIKKARHRYCPLVPVPPHGRCIDADALTDAIESTDWYHQAPNKEMVHGANSAEHQAWYKEQDIYSALEDAPTEKILIGNIRGYLSDISSREHYLKNMTCILWK